MIFVNSMGDLFHSDVTEMSQLLVWQTIRDRSEYTFLMLTKRSKNMAEFFKFYKLPILKNLWLGITAENQKRADERIPVLLQIPAVVRFVSIEPMLEPVDLDKYSGRMRLWKQNQIMYAELAHQYPKCEIPRLDWVIAGPETGPGKRECKPEWIRDLYEQCKSASIPFFDKSKKDWLAREFPKP